MNKFLDILGNIFIVILCILSLPFMIVFAAIVAVIYALFVIVCLPYWVVRYLILEDDYE